ncbi:MAG: mannitol dehydrogenase family protein [Casimicrobiaceae bacterium]
MQRLDLAALPHLPPAVARPAYDPERVAVGIVHLGLGAFHRAHQAVYTDSVLARDPQWGICGVSLKTPRATEALRSQQGLYTVATRSEEGVCARVVGSVREALFAGTDRAGVIARLANPRIRVITATVTEKGYCHDPATGALNREHPDIAHDLAHPEAPRSAVGMLVTGLSARRHAGAGPVTFVCCDNLPHNGQTVAGIVRAFADAQEPGLTGWMRDNVTFPSTMVDRIVPATQPSDVDDVARILGMRDAAPVVAEAFTQWVIEDRFAAARPSWEEGGAQFVADVAPFETMKLRLLNGSHSTLAYVGFLLGHQFAWQAALDPQLAALVERQMAEEIMPTVKTPPGIDLRHYCAQLMQRFRNPALPHRTQQIAMDGSQKLPQRWLGTVRDRIKAGASCDLLAFSVAAWIRYSSGRDDDGKSIAIADPLAATFARMVHDTNGVPANLADAFLGLHQVFGADLSANVAFRDDVRAKVVALFRDGMRASLARQLHGS